MMENLAPAGNREALERAVAAGADAVYLGCAAFNARAGAGNFDEPALRDAVRFCHLHGVRVHVTVNILVKDRELEDLRALLRQLNGIGVDAILVQDLGVLREARRCFPGLTLHASTQMSLHNRTGADWAARNGLRRVVLARECSLDEIRLAAQGQAEIEIFGHGAQCVCVSGQCLFSSMVGGRSGNRGRCAQPCRLPYVFDGLRGAWLSPRDVCLRGHLREAEAAGACSVKLEGRLKRPEYVATVTASYRRGLDGEPETPGERRGLLQIFQRGGFMDGYALGCEDAGVIDPERVNHGGVPLGVVTGVRRGLADLRVGDTLHDGDQLRLETARGDYETRYSGPEVPASGRASLRLREEEAGGIRAGDPVVRLADSAQLAAAMALPLPRIPVDMTLTARAGEPLTLTVSAQGQTVTRAGEPVQPAERRALSEEEAVSRLRKLGETPFAPAACRVETANAFVPVSAFNQLRRDTLAALEEAIIAARTPPLLPERPEDACVLPEGGLPTTVVFREAAQLAELPEGARAVWFPEDWRPEALEAGLAPLPEGVWLQLPTVCEEATLRGIHRFVLAHRARLGGVVLGSVGQLGLDWPLPFGAGPDVPVMNRRAAQFLFEAGCVFVTASPELNREELRVLLAGRPPILVPAFGRTRLMLLTHCPARTALGLRQGHAACALCDRSDPSSLRGKTLTDRTGAAYPLTRIRLPEGCRVALSNHLPTDLRTEVAREGWPQLWTLNAPLEGGSRTTGHWRRGVE